MVMKSAEKMSVFWAQIASVLVSIATELSGLSTSAIPADCRVDQQTLHCAHSIPRWTPHTVSRVFIRGYNEPVIPSFRNVEWEHVVELDITVDEAIKVDMVDNYIFNDLENLSKLGIHGRNVRHLGKYTFDGLYNLTSLDLSWCMYLPFQGDIVPSLTSVSLPKLSALNLAGVESADVYHILIDDNALDMFFQSSITNLNISSTNIMFEEISFNMSLPITELDISNITIMTERHFRHHFPLIFHNLKTVVMNNNERYNLFELNMANELKSTCKSEALLQKLMVEKLYANKVSTNILSIKNTTIDLSKCSIDSINSLQLIHFQNNHIAELDLVLNLPNNNLTEFDLSRNDIKYISPMFLKDFSSLKYFFLAYNNLYRMEYTPDFGKLLNPLTKLEEFSIAHNYLTSIPNDMFVNNSRLRIIDLSGNNLKTVNFPVDYFTQLTRLNLNNNRIKTLSEIFRNNIMALMHKQETHGKIGSVEISLEGNDIECSCETKDFVKWMIGYFQPVEKRSFRCRIDGKLKEINRDTLKETEYLCIRTIVIISAAVSSCCVVTLVTIGVVYVVRKKRLKRQRDNRQNYLEAFRDGALIHGNVQVKYVVFLSHSSEDVDIANKIIFKQLDNTFKDMTDVNRSTVCMGDKDFIPGFSIIEQAMQCLEKACVAILIISDAFCRSQWCEMELKEAYHQQKPIVLIFIERIDENLMSPILLNIFKRQVRATLHHRNGEYVLEPSWHMLCEAVVSLASMHHQDDQGEAEAK